jgi:hypothetical protein
MQTVPPTPKLDNSMLKRLDNHRIFRPEAVEAYTTRRAGDVWITGTRLQGWITAGLTVLAAAAIGLILLGGR